MVARALWNVIGLTAFVLFEMVLYASAPAIMRIWHCAMTPPPNVTCPLCPQCPDCNCAAPPLCPACNCAPHEQCPACRCSCPQCPTCNCAPHNHSCPACRCSCPQCPACNCAPCDECDECARGETCSCPRCDEGESAIPEDDGDDEYPLDWELQHATDIDWGAIERQIRQNPKLTPPAHVVAAYVSHAFKYVRQDQEPLAPLAVTKRPVPLPDPATIDCGNRLYASILTGRKLARPRHIYDVLPFGFELDLLEIRLYELEEVVDYHIFVESVRSQRGWRKPLLYSDSAQRYARFFPKLIPGILDERAIRAIGTNASVPKDKNYFTLEMMQRESARTLFRATFPNVTYNDMMVDWDTDMIPSGYLLWHVKHCELKKCKGFSAKIETYKNRLETCRNGGSHHAVYFVHRKSTTYLRINSPCVGAHFESYGSAAMLTCKYMGLAESWAFPINSYTSVEDKIWAIKNPQRQHEIELSHGSFLGAPHHPNKTEQCRVQDCGGRNFVPWVVANNPDRYPILMRNYDRSWLPAGRVTSNERFTTI